MFSADSSSTGLTSSSSEGNNFPSYGIDQHESGTGLVGSNPPDRQEFQESYLEEFDAGYYYNEDEFSALGDTSTLAEPAVVDDLIENRQNRRT